MRRVHHRDTTSELRIRCGSSSFPEYCLSAGAFPIFKNAVLRYSIVTSGMHEGQDHALIVQCLSQLNGIEQK